MQSFLSIDKSKLTHKKNYFRKGVLNMPLGLNLPGFKPWLCLLLAYNFEEVGEFLQPTMPSSRKCLMHLHMSSISTKSDHVCKIISVVY